MGDAGDTMSILAAAEAILDGDAMATGGVASGGGVCGSAGAGAEPDGAPTGRDGGLPSARLWRFGGADAIAEIVDAVGVSKENGRVS